MHVLSGHCLDQPILRQVGDGRGNDVPCVAQHRHRLANLVNLLQVMRDEEERDPLRLEFAHPDKEPLDLVAIQLSGRLIENDEAGAVGEGAGDLHKLARLDLEVAGAHVLRYRDVPLIENVACLAAQPAPADEAVAPRLAIDQEVLGDRQVGNDGRMLINAGDASPPGLPVRERRRGLAGKAHRPAVRLA